MKPYSYFIVLNAPSKYFTDDLWIADKAPLKILWQNIFIKYRWLITFFIYCFISMLASLLAGKIIFRPQIKKSETHLSDIISQTKKPGTVNASKLLCYGPWNLLTFAGFFLAVIFMRTRQIENGTSSVCKTYLWKIVDIRKILYLALFYLFFIRSMITLYWNFFTIR